MNQRLITNEQAENVLLTFYWQQDDSEKYNEFRSDFGGILLLVAHKHFGWSSGITAEGYLSVVKAYNALDELGFTKEITDEDVAIVLSIFHP